jgi:hypothetical protein
MTVLLVLFLIGAAFIALFFKEGRKLWGLALLGITGFVGVVIVGALVILVLVALIAG